MPTARNTIPARATYVPFPFAAIIGQDEAKLALLLAAINPRVGGVLLSGPRARGRRRWSARPANCCRA